MSPTMQAIVATNDKTAVVQDVAIPQVRDGGVLVKVKAVALNPTDCGHIDNGVADEGAKLGCDYAGIVEEVGNGVTKFKVGDRICGFAHGGNRRDHESGAFGEYLIVDAGFQMRIPDKLSFEQAATLGVSVVTVGQGLYKTLGLPRPSASPEPSDKTVLIYGASTATGLHGVQFAKASGLRVVATASPRNFDYIKSLGADAVFDYKSPTCGADIRAYTNDKLVFAWDCTGSGAEVIANALSSTEKSSYAAIIPVAADVVRAINPNVGEPVLTLGYDAFGKSFWWYGQERVPQPDELPFATEFFELSRQLLAEGVIKPINLVANKTGSGLHGALKGLDELRAGRVSATKTGLYAVTRLRYYCATGMTIHWAVKSEMER